MELAVEIVKLLTALVGLAVAMVASVPKARSWLRRKDGEGQER